MAAAHPPRRILVTGATGFVGRHLLPALRAALPEAIIVAAARDGAAPVADTSVTLDMADAEATAGLVRQVMPEAVVHLAAQAAVPASFADPLGTWRVNLLGTLALAEAVLRTVPDCLFLQASSAEIYGLSFAEGRPLDEAAPMQPANPYAASKAAADLGLGEMALRGLHCLRLRPFNHTGPGQSDAFVVAGFARQVARIEAGLQPPELMVGALDRWRDFLDVRDVCAGYVAALRQGAELPPGTAINLASGRSIRIGDILQALIERAGIQVKVTTESRRLRPTDVERVAGAAGRAEALLGWRPGIPWESTLDAVLADWRQRVR